MADKKLNAVKVVTDMAYVPVILSDGSEGKIAKADLATVVAGYLPFKTFNYTTTSKIWSLRVNTNLLGYVAGFIIIKQPDITATISPLYTLINDGSFVVPFENGIESGTIVNIYYYKI